MTKMHLAQLNIARLVADKDDPRVAEFMENLERVNGIGKRSPGFVWHMEGEGGPEGGNTDACVDGDPRYIANLTVWKDAASLKQFVFKTLHKQFLARSAEWFETADEPRFVMWHVPEGHLPSLEEALERLELLRQNGETAEAFGWAWVAKEQEGVMA